MRSKRLVKRISHSPSSRLLVTTSLALLLTLADSFIGDKQANAQAPSGAACPATTGKDYSGQDLTDHNFRAEPAGSLVGANFTGATLKGAIFAGQDLTGASFQGAALGPSDKGPVDFTNTTLNQTCFINATMDATDFSYAVMTCADFSNTSLMKAQFGP